MGTVWGSDIAEVYDTTYSALAEPSVVDPMVDFQVSLAGQGAALEDRWGSWVRSPFTSDSPMQVAVFVKTGQTE